MNEGHSQVALQPFFFRKMWRQVRPTSEKIVLFSFDVFAVVVAFVAGTEFLRLGELADATPRLSDWLGHGLGSHFICYLSSVCLLFYGFWERGNYSRRLPFWEEQRQLIKLLLSAATTEAALVLLLSEAPFERQAFFLTWVFAGLFLGLGRITAKLMLLRAGVRQRPAIIVGVGRNAELAFMALRNERLMGYPVVGFACLSEQERPLGGTMVTKSGNLPVLVLGDRPGDALSRVGCQTVVIAPDSFDQHASLIHALGADGRNVIVIPPITGLPLYGVEASHFFSHETLMLSVRNNLGRKGSKIIKRIVDICLSVGLMIVLCPLFVWVAWKISRESTGAVLFSQERVGLGGRKFRFLKFRSMALDAEAAISRWPTDRPDLWAQYQAGNFKLKNDPRVLKVGRWIRRTSIDEFPQLLNVLRGEMSLVGPRPLLERELEAYGDSFEFYKEVRPGISGLWQISGRSETSFADRAAYDAWYVRNWSLWYDLVILLRTVKVVLLKDGAY